MLVFAIIIPAVTEIAKTVFFRTLMVFSLLFIIVIG
jgi:hypothetical protein